MFCNGLILHSWRCTAWLCLRLLMKYSPDSLIWGGRLWWTQFTFKWRLLNIIHDYNISSRICNSKNVVQLNFLVFTRSVLRISDVKFIQIHINFLLPSGMLMQETANGLQSAYKHGPDRNAKFYYHYYNTGHKTETIHKLSTWYYLMTCFPVGQHQNWEHKYMWRSEFHL